MRREGWGGDIRRALIPALALSLTGCAGMPGLTIPAAPAPLERTTIDDTALETAWKAFDLALDAINGLADAGAIVPGTPRAKQIAAGIRKVNAALGTAERFAAAGSTTDYATALREATAGINEIRSLIGGQ